MNAAKIATYITVCAAAAAIITAAGQRTTRPGRLKANTAMLAPRGIRTPVWIVPDSGVITVSGFAKPLGSRHESMYLTNRGSRHVRAVRLTLDYRDLSGRQLHNRSDSVGADLPAGQTRHVRLQSFDREGTCCYLHSVNPRSRSRQTVFTVTVRVDSVVCDP